MMPRGELRKLTIALIEEAFTTREARVDDDPFSGRSWQEISDDELDDFLEVYGFSVFGNDDFRFYLSAFMRRSLQSYESQGGGFDLTTMLSKLSCGPGFFHRGGTSIFTPREEEAIAAFLFFIASHGNDFDKEGAEAALKIGWWKHLPDYAFLD